MKHVMLPALVAGVIAGASLGHAAAALAAPSGPQTVFDTVKTLETNGFQVVLNKTGTAPLDQCVVTSVRRGPSYSRRDSGAAGAGNSIVTTVTAKTVYVDATC